LRLFSVSVLLPLLILGAICDDLFFGLGFGFGFGGGFGGEAFLSLELGATGRLHELSPVAWLAKNDFPVVGS
jgi:hypothetical protein